MKSSSYVPNTRNSATAHQRGSSANTTDIKTITLGSMTSAVYITVETTNARVTFDGSDPSAANAPSLVIPVTQLPLLVPVTGPTAIKWVSTAGTAAVLQVLELT